MNSNDKIKVEEYTESYRSCNCCNNSKWDSNDSIPLPNCFTRVKRMHKLTIGNFEIALCDKCLLELSVKTIAKVNGIIK